MYRTDRTIGTGIFRDKQMDWKEETAKSAEPARWGQGPLSSPEWNVVDVGTGSLPAPDIYPPCVAIRHNFHTWVPPCTCAHPSPTVCRRMPGPASSCATCSMHWALTCWPSVACCGQPSSSACHPAPKSSTRSSTEGTCGVPGLL